MRIVKVVSKSHMREFVRLPKHIYENNDYWVPPLWHEENHAYYAKNNVMLQNNEHQLFILIDDSGKTIGRILVYIDSSFIKHTNNNIGFFGVFECIEDQRAADLLLDTARAWLIERRIDFMRGPIHPIAESWGFLLEGYESEPVLMAPYNLPYYHDQMESFGLKKIKDLYAYEANCQTGYRIPERIERFATTFSEKHPEITLRPIRLKDLMQDAEHIWRITNIALSDNWGYVPVGHAVLLDMVKRLKTLLDTDAIWFIEEFGRPVGFALGFPDPNSLIKKIDGRLFPFGFIRFLLEKSKIKRYRLISLGVLPEYHGKGLDVLLYRELNKALASRGIILEANYILEDNWNIRNALEKLKLQKTKVYRIYQMPI